MPGQHELHLYDRQLENEGRSSLTVICDLVGRGSTVLDIGCGTGALGRRLRERRGCHVDGLTHNPEEARIAAPHYRQVVVADLETQSPGEVLGSRSYDYVVCADVIEHLRRPDRLMRELAPLLAPRGELLLSVPNVGYCGILAELLQGDFRYRQEGLLDGTHLRFFTRRSLLRLLDDCGWDPLQLETVERELSYSEFEPTMMALPPGLRQHLIALPDAFTYQFIVRARRAGPAADSPIEPLPDFVPQLPGRPIFTTAIGMLLEADYCEQTRLFSHGLIAEQRQTIRFPLPALATPARKLRFEPAHRAGLMALYAIRIVAGADRVTWAWDARPESLTGQSRTCIELDTPPPTDSGVILRMTADDPSIELPIPAPQLTSAFDGHHRIAVEISWPMSPDYCSVVPPLAARLEAAEKARHETESQTRQLRRELDAILQSRSYRAVRLLTWPKRMLSRLAAKSSRRE